MPDPTNTERQRRWRERQAGKQPPAVKPACSSCGKIHTGAHGSLCRDCFRKSPDGKVWQRLRMASYRSARPERIPAASLDELTMSDPIIYTLQGGPAEGKRIAGLMGDFIKIPYLASNGVGCHIYERASDGQFHYTRSEND